MKPARPNRAPEDALALVDESMHLLVEGAQHLGVETLARALGDPVFTENELRFFWNVCTGDPRRAVEIALRARGVRVVEGAA